MRNLTKSQKKIIEKAMQTNRQIHQWEDLSNEQMDELEKINDTEILCQEINRYINDIKFK